MSLGIRELNESDRDFLRRCKETVSEIMPGAQLILYGSRARGDAGEDSDYDLLVLVNEPVDWKKERLLGDCLYNIELETGKLLSAQVISLDNWNSHLYHAMPFRKNVEQEGIRL